MHLRLMKTGKSHWFAFALWFPFRSTITATDKPHGDPQVGWPADTVLSTVGTTPQPPDLLTLTPAFSPFYFSLHPPIDFHQWHISKQLFLYTSQTFYFLQLGFFSQRLPNWCPGQCFPSPTPLLPFWFTSTLFLTTKGRIGKGPKCFWILFISSNKPSHFIKLILTTFLANSCPWHQSDPMHLPGGLTGVTVPWTLEPQTKPSTTACLNRISSVYHVNAMAKYTQYVQGAQTLDLNSCARATWPGHPVVTQLGSQMSCMVWAGRWQSPFPAL